MDTDAEKFFQAGLREYGRALRAVTDFKGDLIRTLQEALERKARESSAVLTLAADPKFAPSIGQAPSPFISVFATLNEPRVATEEPKEEGAASLARLELGLWWSPTFDSTADLVVYSGIMGMPWSKQLRPAAGFPGKHHKSYASAYLTLPFNPGEQQLSPVLDGLLVHVDCAARMLLVTTRG